MISMILPFEELKDQADVLVTSGKYFIQGLISLALALYSQ